jgi:hypothetical protein
MTKKHQERYSLSTIQGWLHSRGGRNATDLKDEGAGLYVLMADGNGGLMKVYLPESLQNNLEKE